MQHQIYPDRFNDDGEFVPAVIVEVPDILYLQVVDTDDCEDWPAPSDPGERTHCDERINASDVAYVPLARAERAEAEAQSAILAASDAERALANCRALLDALYDSAAETEVRLNAKLDKAQAGLAALEAAQEWRPNDDQALFEDKDIEGEIILTATFQQRNHCWNVDGISILPSGVVAWRPRTAAPDEEE